MWTFAGCCVIAFVLYFGLRRLTRAADAILFIFERAVNLGALRNGHPPVTTREDAEQFR